jgi:hypothetical protein
MYYFLILTRSLDERAGTFGRDELILFGYRSACFELALLMKGMLHFGSGVEPNLAGLECCVALDRLRDR